MHKIVIVGAAGHQGQEYYDILKKDYKLSGLVDINEPALNALYGKGDIPLFGSIGEAFSKCQFDVALICVPHAHHYAVTLPLAAAGKMIIKEKPLALSSQETQIYKKVQKKGIFTIVQREFHALFNYIAKQLSNLGKIYDFHYQYWLNLPSETSGWRGNFAYSAGGVIIDMGYHIFDVVLRLFGQPERVSGALSYCYDQTGTSHLEDAAALTFAYPNKQLCGTIHLNRYAVEKRETLEVFGSEGMLLMDKSAVTIKNRRGETVSRKVIEEKSATKERMFHFFLHKAHSKHFSSNHLNHHVRIVSLIEHLYETLR